MSRELRIERAFDHLATELRANRDQFPIPEAYLSLLLPVLDAFGTSRAGEIAYAEILGGLGNVEVTHGPVPDGFVRKYLSVEYWHQDAVNRFLRAGRVVPVSSGFPFVAVRDAVGVPANQELAVRNLYVPAGGFAAVRADAMGAGAQTIVRVVYVDVRTGEYSLLE